MTPSPAKPGTVKKSFDGMEKSSILINALFKKFQEKHQGLKAEFCENAVPEKRFDFHNRLTALVDETLTAAASLLQDGNHKKSRKEERGLPCIIAVGGYGRRELAPSSDVDVLFLTEDALSASGRKIVETLNTAFWNAGVKLSYSVRTLEDCEEAMRSDLYFITSLLEKRRVWGPEATYERLEAALEKYLAASSPSVFVAAKLAEQEARHKKMGDTRYHLQPNLKESKGGLRDIHTLLWIANFLYGETTPKGLVKKGLLTAQEARTLQQAQEFFWTVRWHLHAIAGRGADRLSFDVQPEIALRMGYGDAEPNRRAERFMKDYFRMAAETGHLTRILCAAIEAQSLGGGATAGTKKLALAGMIEGFPVANNRLTAETGHFERTPSDIVRIFRVSQNSGHDIHPDALRAMRDTLPEADFSLDGEAYRLFLLILLDEKKSEQTLRRLNEAGVLSALLPDFGNIFAHMQYDMYHVFTADEHTIRAVGMMHAIENGDLTDEAPLAHELFRKIHSRRALYAAMFLHDIAKGTGGQHSAKGAAIAKKVCPLLGLAPEETETVAWLVENHLLMTMTAFKRDLNDPKSIADFVAAVQSPERLKLLHILTCADIMAVGPDRWNAWKAGLLAELYYKSAEHMSGTPRDRDDDEQFIIARKKTRRLVGEDAPTLQYLSDYAPRYFWLSFTPENIASFVKTLRKHPAKEPTVIKVTPEPNQGYTEVFVFTPDRKGLFATLSGAMAASGASIVDARIFTLSNGMALDVFQIQALDGQVYENTAFLQKTLKSALAGSLDLEAEIAERRKGAPQKGRHFAVQPRVIIDNDASASNTVIEVNGRDRPGFLFDVTSALTQAGLQISAAKVTTFGARAVDVFYVKDAFGLKITHREKIAAVESRLKEALGKNG